MANNHVRPGQSVTWRNVTGAPVRSGALVPFGGGVAAKALHAIEPDAWGEVTFFQMHRVQLPAGLSFAPGDLVYVRNGQISDSGDVLGRFIRLDEGGWAEILILPLTPGGGGGGGTSDIAWKPTVTADGDISWTRTSSTTAPEPQNIKGPKGDGADLLINGSARTVTVNASDRVIVVIDNVAPSGYQIAAYRQISLSSGDNSENWRRCAVQFFSTTNGGVSAQVSVLNTGAVETSVRVTVNCLCMRV